MNYFETYKRHFQETSELAGACQAVHEAISAVSDVEERFFLKILLRSLIKQLITDLHILSGDSNSNVSLKELLNEFDKLYGGYAKEIGEAQQIINEKAFLEQMQSFRDNIKTLRHNFSAHLNSGYENSWEISKDDISLFLKSIRKILDLLNKIPQTPKRPTDGSLYSYTVSNVPHNFEEYIYSLGKKFFESKG